MNSLPTRGGKTYLYGGLPSLDVSRYRTHTGCRYLTTQRTRESTLVWDTKAGMSIGRYVDIATLPCAEGTDRSLQADRLS